MSMSMLVDATRGSETSVLNRSILFGNVSNDLRISFGINVVTFSVNLKYKIMKISNDETIRKKKLSSGVDCNDRRARNTKRGLLKKKNSTRAENKIDAGNVRQRARNLKFDTISNVRPEEIRLQVTETESPSLV